MMGLNLLLIKNRGVFLVLCWIFYMLTQSTFAAEDDHLDWAQLHKYAAQNEQLDKLANDNNRIVFFGDSITEAWFISAPTLSVDNKLWINRGISGQTTQQMLVRFKPDVVALHPQAVVILAGTNDIARNMGIVSNAFIEDNIATLAEWAKLHHVKVILCSILPTRSYSWRPEVQPVDTIHEINRWIKKYAADNDLMYVDYYAAMIDDNNGLRKELSEDGVHPNQKGYQIMNQLVRKTINSLSPK